MEYLAFSLAFPVFLCLKNFGFQVGAPRAIWEKEGFSKQKNLNWFQKSNLTANKDLCWNLGMRFVCPKNQMNVTLQDGIVFFVRLNAWFQLIRTWFFGKFIFAMWICQSKCPKIQFIIRLVWQTCIYLDNWSFFLLSKWFGQAELHGKLFYLFDNFFWAQRTDAPSVHFVRISLVGNNSAFFSMSCWESVLLLHIS